MIRGVAHLIQIDKVSHEDKTTVMQGEVEVLLWSFSFSQLVVVVVVVVLAGSRIFYVWIIFAPFSHVVASHDSKVITSRNFTCGVLTSWILVEVIR